VTTLLYDAECSFCRTVLGAILARDRERRIRPVALQDALAADLLPGMSEEDRFASFHVVEEDGTVHSGGRALPRVFAELPGAGWLARATASTQPLTDLAYELVSRNRSRIGPRVPASWTSRADAGIRRREAELGGDVVEQASDELERVPE
jgi:predicted DCC family thiol-disulfide oxidoreductase YuxK